MCHSIQIGESAELCDLQHQPSKTNMTFYTLVGVFLYLCISCAMAGPAAFGACVSAYTGWAWASSWLGWTAATAAGQAIATGVGTAMATSASAAASAATATVVATATVPAIVGAGATSMIMAAEGATLGAAVGGATAGALLGPAMLGLIGLYGTTVVTACLPALLAPTP